MEQRLIDADDFLDLFYVMSMGQDKLFISAVEQVIEDTPTVEAVPVVHGRWLKTTYCTIDVRRCSNCKEEVTIDGHDNYCPNCGSKMDGQEATDGKE